MGVIDASSTNISSLASGSLQRSAACDHARTRESAPPTASGMPRRSDRRLAGAGGALLVRPLAPEEVPAHLAVEGGLHRRQRPDRVRGAPVLSQGWPRHRGVRVGVWKLEDVHLGGSLGGRDVGDWGEELLEDTGEVVLGRC